MAFFMLCYIKDSLLGFVFSLLYSIECSAESET